MKAIETRLKSDNETIKLKTAFWLLEKREAKKIDETKPQNVFKKLCNTMEGWENHFHFDKARYEKLCQKKGLNLKPQLSQ